MFIGFLYDMISFIILCSRMWFSTNGWASVSSHLSLIYDFSVSLTEGQLHLKKRMRVSFWTALGYVGLFDLFFKKNKILRAVCEFSVWSLLHLCVCVAESLEGLSSGIFRFARVAKFIFPLAFGPLVSGQGRGGITEVAAKELLGVKF